MWIMMSDGFVSAVECNDDATSLMVRARRRGILRKIVLELPGKPKITRNDDADYRWRIKVSKDDFSRVVAARVRNIGYGNFKGSVADNDKPLKEFYAKVWTCGWNYQVADDVPPTSKPAVRERVQP